MDIKGAAAIVSGGASGLGEATVRRLAAGGAEVTILDFNAEKGEALAKDLQLGLGIRVSVEVGDPGSLPRWDHKARRVTDERTEVPF